MRVGIDTSNLRGGGGITHLVELLGHADPRASGIERVTVWGSAATLALLPDREWLSRIEEKELEGGLRARLAWQRGKLTALAREACDVLFVPGGAFGGRFHPYVTMCRNMLPFDLREAARYGLSWMFLRLLLLRFAQRRAFRNADGMIYLNDYVRGLVDRGHAPETTTVVPHGVSDRFRSAPRPQRPIEEYSEEKPFTILYTSIVDVYKHQWNVAAAVMKLREEGLPVVLKLAGGSYPPSMKKLRDVLTRDTQHVVELRGEVPHATLPEMYQAADLFVFASTCENMPNILIEAMAAGLPIASSAHPPMPQFLGDAGIYFDPSQPEEIARAIRTLIADPSLRATLAARAFARAAQYSWERCARETFDFLAAIATRKGAAA